jgi:signal transduction histidine kinase
MGRKSLATRIIALSGGWVIMAMIITALLLVYSYRDHAVKHYDEHVSMHLEELIEASELSPDGAFKLTFDPTDPRYQVPDSGWYWEVRRSGQTLARSPSLGGNQLGMGATQPTGNVVIHEITGPVEEKLRVQLIAIKQFPGQEPLVYLSSNPMKGFSDDVMNYSSHIIGSFLLLGLGLLTAVFLQVRVALRPLQAISNGIAGIRAGKANKLPESNLCDVQPLVDELNHLLEHNAVLLKRARNQLADLAHSVKNPLTVINNEARNMNREQMELILKQTHDINRNVDHYLTRARTFGTEKVLGARSAVKPVFEDLVYAMQRIYQDRDLDYDLSGLTECWFRGEGQDLEEMLGNLMDNACKWAGERVMISASVEGNRLRLTVEDDGPGIPETEIENVMRRGQKLDESKSGHGQGLGIVKDIVDLYGGFLRLHRGDLGGLRTELDLPAA